MECKYNYILLNEGFHNWLETNYLPIPSQNLFFKLIHLFNLSGWSEWLAVDNQRMMSLIQIKREKSFIDLRNKLIEKGFIVLVKGKKGSPNKYKLNDKFTFINEAKTEVNTEVNTEIKKAVKTEVQTEDIYKQNKTKKNKKESIADAIPKNWGPVRVYGEFRNVLLADDEYEKLKKLCGDELQGVIDHLSSYIEMKGYKVKSHYLAIRKWVITAYKEQKMREEKIAGMTGGIGYGRYPGYPQKKLCTEYPE